MSCVCNSEMRNYTNAFEPVYRKSTVISSVGLKFKLVLSATSKAGKTTPFSANTHNEYAFGLGRSSVRHTIAALISDLIRRLLEQLHLELALEGASLTGAVERSS